MSGAKIRCLNHSTNPPRCERKKENGREPAPRLTSAFKLQDRKRNEAREGFPQHACTVISTLWGLSAVRCNPNSGLELSAAEYGIVRRVAAYK